MTWSDASRLYYVVADDKLRILTAIKQFWGARVTTAFVRQGTYAHDPKVVGAFPAADVTFERIGELLDCDLPRLRSAPCVHAPRLESAQ